MSLDRRDYKTAIPQLEKKILEVQEENLNGLNTDVSNLKSLIQQETVTREKENAKALTNVTIEYALGDNSTTAPTTGWSTNSPVWTVGKYVWQRTVVTKNGETSYSNVACIQGAKGEDGTSVTILGSYDTLAELEADHPTGTEGDAYLVNGDLYVWNGSSWENVGQIKGDKGDTGATGNGIASTTIVYGKSNSESTQPSTWGVLPVLSKGDWLWVKTTITYTDSTTSVSYSKSYVGTDGEDGNSIYVQSATHVGNVTTVVLVDDDGNTTSFNIADGADGTNGINGAKGYVHLAWANSADGSVDFSTTVSTGKQYLGTYSDNTQADSQVYSDYNWSKIKGEKGDDGDSVHVQSATHSGNKTTIVFVDDSGTTTSFDITDGADGNDGIDGINGLNGYVHVAWANSADGSVDFSTSVSTGKQYLGTYTDNTQADSQVYSDYSWSKIKGEQGVQGNTGISVTETKQIYYLTTGTPTALSDGTEITSVSTGANVWTTVIPTYISGYSYYTATQTKYSSGTSPKFTGVVLDYALTQSCQDAYDAKAIADNTDQYFWFTSTDPDETGAHITQVPQDDWDNPLHPDYHSGGNLLARSNGIAVRDGLTELATFGANGSQIGVTGESHLEMDYRSINLVDKQNDTYFYVSDLRDKNTGTYQVKESFIATENQTDFWVDVNIYQIVSVKVDNVVLASTEYTYTTGQVLFELITPPQEGATVEVIYTTNSPLAKAYTLGTRKSANQVGACSFVEGYDNAASKACSHAEGRDNVASGTHAHAEGRGVIASGYSSHAEGTHTVASGNHSHAEGYETTAKGYYSHAGGRGTIAKSFGQTAIGMYNIETTGALIIGSGSDDEHRSNALTVDWNGDLTVSRHSSPIGSFYLDNATTAALTANIDAYKSGASITLDAGTYVVYCYGSMGTNSSAAQLRAIRLYRVTPNAAGLWSWRNVYPNGNWATISATLPMKLEETTTLRVDASASVAGNGASTWIIAVRIA